MNTILDTCLNEFWPVSGLNSLKLNFNSMTMLQFPLILKSWNALNHFITCSKPSLSSHIWTKGEEHLSANTDSWQVQLKHLYKIYRLQGQKYAECYCKNNEKLIKKNPTNNVKYFYYNIISHTTEWYSTSAAATNGTKRLSLSETPLQNLLTARAKSLLYPSKHYYKVEVPWCYCNSNMKTLQKIQKDKLFYENLVSQWQTEKKMPNFTQWPSAFLHGQRISKKAKFFKIGHEMVNLATLAQEVECS